MSDPMAADLQDRLRHLGRSTLRQLTRNPVTRCLEIPHDPEEDLTQLRDCVGSAVAWAALPKAKPTNGAIFSRRKTMSVMLQQMEAGRHNYWTTGCKYGTGFSPAW